MDKIIWAPSALKDIDSVATFIAADSAKAAKNMVELFFEKAKILELFPPYGKPVKVNKRCQSKRNIGKQVPDN
ncbi:MAG: type II toxin-antitoxin system RelE/ParE family toxin [Ferruginibacter sp.]